MKLRPRQDAWRFARTGLPEYLGKAKGTTYTLNTRPCPNSCSRFGLSSIATPIRGPLPASSSDIQSRIDILDIKGAPKACAAHCSGHSHFSQALAHKVLLCMIPSPDVFQATLKQAGISSQFRAECTTCDCDMSGKDERCMCLRALHCRCLHAISALQRSTPGRPHMTTVGQTCGLLPCSRVRSKSPFASRSRLKTNQVSQFRLSGVSWPLGKKSGWKLLLRKPCTQHMSDLLRALWPTHCANSLACGDTVVCDQLVP